LKVYILGIFGMIVGGENLPIDSVSCATTFIDEGVVYVAALTESTTVITRGSVEWERMMMMMLLMIIVSLLFVVSVDGTKRIIGGSPSASIRY
jgi:hypothetical protein